MQHVLFTQMKAGIWAVAGFSFLFIELTGVPEQSDIFLHRWEVYTSTQVKVI